MEEPLYSIDPHIYCSGIVLVNDVPVTSFFGKETEGRVGQIGGLVINHVLLESGTYKVVGKMYPRYGNKTLTETDTMFIDFYLAEASLDKWKASRHKFHPAIESPWGGLSENINYPYFEIATEIEVELPFVLNGWQNSVNLKDMDEKDLFNQVLNYYQQIRLVLKEHDAGKYLSMSKEKMELQEQAFYFTDERKEDFIAGASKLFSQNLEVEALVPENLKLELMGYGKLVRLMRLDGTEALQFTSPNPTEQSNIELEIKLHMRTKEKGFSII